MSQNFNIQEYLPSIQSKALESKCIHLVKPLSIAEIKTALEKRGLNKGGSQIVLRNRLILELKQECTTQHESTPTLSVETATAPTTASSASSSSSHHHPHSPATKRTFSESEEQQQQHQSSPASKKQRTTTATATTTTSSPTTTRSAVPVIPAESISYPRRSALKNATVASPNVHIVVDPATYKHDTSLRWIQEGSFQVSTHLYESITKAQNGDIILLTAGVHKITAGLHIDKDIEIIGLHENREKVIIEAAGSENKEVLAKEDFFLCISCGAKVRFFNLEMRVSNHRVSQGHGMLFCKDGSYVEVDRCILDKGAIHGVAIRSKSSAIIRNSVIRDCTGSAVYADSCANVLILINNRIYGCGHGDEEAAKEKPFVEDEDDNNKSELILQESDLSINARKARRVTLKKGYFAAVEIVATDMPELVVAYDDEVDIDDIKTKRDHSIQCHIINNNLHDNFGSGLGVRTNSQFRETEKAEAEHLMFRFDYIPRTETRNNINEIFEQVKKNIHLAPDNTFTNNGESFPASTIETWKSEDFESVFEIAHLLLPRRLEDQETREQLDISCMEETLHFTRTAIANIERTEEYQELTITAAQADLDPEVKITYKQMIRAGVNSHLRIFQSKKDANKFITTFTKNITCTIGKTKQDEEDEDALKRFWNAKHTCIACTPTSSHEAHLLDSADDNLFAYLFQQVAIAKGMRGISQNNNRSREKSQQTKMYLCKHGHVTINEATA